MICKGCRKKIQGKYLQAMGSFWHPECFICGVCKSRVTGHFVAYNGKPYHRCCYEEKFTIKCAGCNQPIGGKFVKALGKFWHPEHFCCHKCGKPIGTGRFYEKDGHAYCEKDYHRLFSKCCSVCNKVLEGKYIKNFWGDQYCPHHEKDIPKCFSCGRLVSSKLTGGCMSYKDGHRLCKICYDGSRQKSAQRNNLVPSIQKFFSSIGCKANWQKIPIQFTSLQQLKALSKSNYQQQPVGLIRTTVQRQGSFVTHRSIRDILVLDGISHIHLSAVLAHELGHGYLFMNFFPTLPPMVEEGIAELFSYLWLQKQFDEEARYRMHLMENNRDPIYGIGFRQAYKSWQKNANRFFSHVKKHKTFPR
jgi:hypothetical protein